jgi:hypothetical protein
MNPLVCRFWGWPRCWRTDGRPNAPLTTGSRAGRSRRIGASCAATWQRPPVACGSVWREKRSRRIVDWLWGEFVVYSTCHGFTEEAESLCAEALQPEGHSQQHEGLTDDLVASTVMAIGFLSRRFVGELPSLGCVEKQAKRAQTRTVSVEYPRRADHGERLSPQPWRAESARTFKQPARPCALSRVNVTCRRGAEGPDCPTGRFIT